jgi:AraC-like DNA-binding protein
MVLGDVYDLHTPTCILRQNPNPQDAVLEPAWERRRQRSLNVTTIKNASSEQPARSTVRAYVQTLRIEEAKHMLETGSAAVDAIGREVGYEDAASFRRLTGIPPGDYRRRFRIPRSVASVATRARIRSKRYPARAS